jgi:pimeloyl-ACP methyl ester carboxylesterase
MPSKPSIVIVPGAFHSPAHYARLAEHLQGLGYPCVTVALPSVGASPPVPTFVADVDAIRGAVLDVLHAGRDCIAVLHSYGGIPGCEAMRGLAKAERAQIAHEGGVLAILFIASLVVPEGNSLFAARGGAVPPEWDVQVRLWAFISFSLSRGWRFCVVGS